MTIAIVPSSRIRTLSWSNFMANLKDVSPGVSMMVTLITGTMMFLLTGGSVTWYLASTINQSQRDTEAAINIVLNRVASDEARIAADEAKLGYLEKQLAEEYASDVSFRDKIDTQVSVMIQALADLKVQLAGKENLSNKH